MSNDLYFVPVSVKALDSPQPETALLRAFAEIEERGQQPEYRWGHAQFRRFMDLVVGTADRSHDASVVPEDAATLMVELTAGCLEGTAEEAPVRALLVSRPVWREALEALMREMAPPVHESGTVDLTVMGPEGVTESIHLSAEVESAWLTKVVPGPYLMRLSTGRVLWNGQLAAADLLWSEAYPEGDLRFAATDKHHERIARRTIPVLGGEVMLHLYPGPESGELRVVLRGGGRSSDD